MESSRRIIILLVVGVVMIFGIIALRSFTGSEEPAAPVDQPIRVITSKRDIPQGSIIQPATDLDWVVVKPEELKETHLREGSARLEDFTGAIVRRQIRAGEMVPASALTRAGEGGFMSAVLEPGMRAVSVAVNATSGNAGFISPGDRVDLIVTHRVRNQNNNNPEGSVVSETFVRDVRVIAVDQQLDNPDNKAILAKTVTVEVSPRQAEQIAVATDLGKISLTLRGAVNSDQKIEVTVVPAAPAAPTEAAGAFPPAAPALAPEDSRILTDLYGNVVAAPHTYNYTRDSDVSQALDTGGLSSTIRVIRGDQVESVSLH